MSLFVSEVPVACFVLPKKLRAQPIPSQCGLHPENWRSRSSVPLHGHHLSKLVYPSLGTGWVTPELFHRLQRAGYRLPLCCPRRFRADTNAGAFRLPPFLQHHRRDDRNTDGDVALPQSEKASSNVGNAIIKWKVVFLPVRAKRSGCVSVVCTLKGSAFEFHPRAQPFK